MQTTNFVDIFVNKDFEKDICVAAAQQQCIKRDDTVEWIIIIILKKYTHKSAFNVAAWRQHSAAEVIGSCKESNELAISRDFRAVNGCAISLFMLTAFAK